MKKNTLLQKLCSTLIVSILMVTTCVVVSADSYDSFTIDAQIPENQINANAEYFDLLMSDNQEQILIVNIHNRGQEDMIAKVNLNDATTGNNAVKQFMTELTPDASLKVPLSSIAEIVNEDIFVKKGESTQAFIKINMNDTKFDGIILGGISVIANTQSDAANQVQDQGVQIENQLSYLIAVQLRMNDNPVQRNLNLKGVDSKLIGFQPTIIATIQNDQAILMNNVTLQGAVYKKGTKEQVGFVNTSGNGINPNTNFDVTYTLNDKKIKAGAYTVELKITHEDKTWEWSEDLTIESKQADQLNDQAIFSKTPINWFMVMAIAVLFILLLIILFLLLTRRNDKKTEQA